MEERFDPDDMTDRPLCIGAHEPRDVWIRTYSIAMLAGAFIVPGYSFISIFIVTYLLQGLGGEIRDWPMFIGAILLQLVVASVIGAIGGLVLILPIHLIAKLIPHRPPTNFGKLDRNLSDGF